MAVPHAAVPAEPRPTLSLLAKKPWEIAPAPRGMNTSFGRSPKRLVIDKYEQADEIEKLARLVDATSNGGSNVD